MKKALSILLVLTLVVALVVPAFAAKKGDSIEIFGEKFTVLDVVNRTYAFNHDPALKSRVWPANQFPAAAKEVEISKGGDRWFTNNGGQKASDMVYIGKTSLGLTWVLERDDFFCPICGSNVWASYSNQSGAPNGNNIQVVCVMEAEMIDCGKKCNNTCPSHDGCADKNHPCNNRDCDYGCECECECVYDCNEPCPNGVCNDANCGKEIPCKKYGDWECGCVCKCIIPDHNYGGMRIQSHSQDAFWWNLAGIIAQINNNSGYGFAYLEVDADYFDNYSGIEVAFNRTWITGGDPSRFNVVRPGGISWAANAQVVFTADDFTLVDGKLVVNLIEYFNAPFQNSGNYFNQAILIQVIAVDVNG